MNVSKLTTLSKQYLIRIRGKKTKTTVSTRILLFVFLFVSTEAYYWTIIIPLESNNMTCFQNVDSSFWFELESFDRLNIANTIVFLLPN